jgi:hypothetical protein
MEKLRVALDVGSGEYRARPGSGDTVIDVHLIGANPGVALFESEDDALPVAYASAWRVDWSIAGAGDVLITWFEGVPQAVSEVPKLAEWLAGKFNRHFPEVSGLVWPDPKIVVAPVRYECDLTSGAHIEAAGVTVDITQPLTSRFVNVGSFPLGAESLGLSTLISPCRQGSIAVGGAKLPGSPRIQQDAVASSAFLANAEVWYQHDGDHRT